MRQNRVSIWIRSESDRPTMLVDASRERDRRTAPFCLFPDALQPHRFDDIQLRFETVI
jgi:hypothetical protein